MHDFTKTLLSACRDAKNIIITTHMGPDDDAVGSALAAKHFLDARLERDVPVFIEGAAPERWSGFPGFSDIIFVEDLRDAAKDADVILFLDGSEKRRFSQEPLESGAETFCIDHHPCEDPDFDQHVIDPSRTSTAELLYDVLYAREVDETAARYLLLGVLGDTGNFRYVNAGKAGVFSVAKALVEAGDIDIEQFQRSYGATKKGEFAVFARLMGNVVIQEDARWPTYAYSFLEDADVFSDTDLSGGAHMFISFIKGVEDVGWGFVLTPRSDGRVACSFRSTGVNVRNIAEGIDVGGGHDRAAGARFETSVPEAVRLIQGYLADHEPEMT